MRMRSKFVTIAAVLALAAPAAALEKFARYDTDVAPERDTWAAGFPTCAIVYYNYCTQWSWSWTGFRDGERLGVCADNCCLPDNGAVTATTLRVFTGSPIGYGFTGSVALEYVDANCCPSGVVASRPWLPTGPFDTHVFFNLMPLEFAIVYTIAGSDNPAGFGTDHPAAGPTGPQACGFCYPTNRTNHSFMWGTLAEPSCPGSTFHDGVCDAQLRLDIYGVCPSAVDTESWGSIKGLYR